MRRIALALSVAVSVWLGSSLAAEAQTVNPSGPVSVISGSPSTNYTADIYLPTLAPYRLRLQILRGTQELHYSETVYPKPTTQNSSLTKSATLGYPVYAGDVLTFVSAIKVGTIWYNANNWVVTVTATRPSKTDSYQKRSILAVQSVDRDRRRE